MAEDYKGQFKNIKKEFGIPIKEIKILDAKGELGDLLQSLREKSNLSKFGGYKIGGLLTKKKPIKKVVKKKPIKKVVKKKKK